MNGVLVTRETRRQIATRLRDALLPHLMAHGKPAAIQAGETTLRYTNAEIGPFKISYRTPFSGAPPELAPKNYIEAALWQSRKLERRYNFDIWGPQHRGANKTCKLANFGWDDPQGAIDLASFVPGEWHLDLLPAASPPRWQVCLHEAGHAAFDWFAGCPVVSVSVGDPMAGTLPAAAVGGCKAVRPSLDWATDDPWAPGIKRLAVLLAAGCAAGPFAEAKKLNCGWVGILDDGPLPDEDGSKMRLALEPYKGAAFADAMGAVDDLLTALFSDPTFWAGTLGIAYALEVVDSLLGDEVDGIMTEHAGPAANVRRRLENVLAPLLERIVRA